MTDDLAANEALLKKFVFLLGADRVVPVVGRSHLYELRSTSEKVGRYLTRKFYEFYSLLRHDSFLMLCEQNPSESRHAVLAAAQKLLDRVLFCCFCEDRGLLPLGTVTTLSDGDFFGEIALLKIVTRTATIKMLTPTVLLTRSRSAFLQIFTESPTLREVLERVMTQRN